MPSGDPRPTPLAEVLEATAAGHPLVEPVETNASVQSSAEALEAHRSAVFPSRASGNDPPAEALEANAAVPEPVEGPPSTRTETLSPTLRQAQGSEKVTRRRFRLAIPPQHGAWAYLALPLLLGLTLSGWTWLGTVFAVTWVLAYPASYYLGRAFAVRLRRGSWSRIAIRERASAVPWAATAAVGAVVLLVARPWLAGLGLVLAVLWLVGVRLVLAGRERGFGNDLLLIGQALLALPLSWAITKDQLTGIPASIWWGTGICAIYFVGSVIHVKSLIREAGDRRWRTANVGFHVAALALGLLSAWLLVPFAAALARSVALRPGTRPGVIGAVETVVSVLVLVATLLAVTAR